MQAFTIRILIYSLFIPFLVFEFCKAADRITSDESIRDGETLVSSGKFFELGFFSPSGSNSTSRYLGIWYKKFPKIVVWIANREVPLRGSNGVLSISTDGNLALLNCMTNRVVWSSNSSTTVQSSIAQILDSGNLVVRENSNTSVGSYIWQSFDFPSDTLLPGMKLGWNLTSGQNRYLTSWKDTSDPSPGDFTCRIDNLGLPQFVLRKGSEKKMRTGPWNGLRYSGTYSLRSPVVKYSFVSNSDEHYHMIKFSSEVMGRLTVKQPGVIQQSNVKSPDLLEFRLDKGMDLEQCEAACLKNCSCTAFANSDIRGGGTGCLNWFGDLVDIREFSEQGSELDIHIRMPASELDNSQEEKRLILLMASISTASGMLVLGLLTWRITRRRKKKLVTDKAELDFLIRKNKEDTELPQFDMATITAATDNFSSTNLIGKGGFGPVYKGTLSMGQEVAIKRLSKDSGQGVQEFKNEIILISKLQHRNLIRILGCCLEGEERMLVYEYMPNKSLDFFIFGVILLIFLLIKKIKKNSHIPSGWRFYADESRSVLLTWQSRFEIAIGIAKGLLYLHQDSRLNIIHRDLKASNILLDSRLNPKISDFGIARSFGGDQDEANTKRVVGTYGYMSPEYAIAGKFSVKSDVFSFGVLLLEIVSGKRNTRYHDHPDHYHSLLGLAWLLWSEGKALELLDSCLKDSYVESQVVRCVQVGLLCVQKFPKERPTMSSVLFMLINEGVRLAQPKQPGFFGERSSDEIETLRGDSGCHSRSAVTITMLEAREYCECHKSHQFLCLQFQNQTTKT
ncbi:hypothetical protein RJ640_004570 [Escallonia rubra]|uniref:Receptor-like serine/threonine-protein kinase n=1 Tax=Escallonia rubra TaxID=112253 RepID=A0AA88S935_9ASTE|nr:hypothetical protein RJ640_004570 [Escallonia rubra]